MASLSPPAPSSGSKRKVGGGGFPRKSGANGEKRPRTYARAVPSTADSAHLRPALALPIPLTSLSLSRNGSNDSDSAIERQLLLTAHVASAPNVATPSIGDSLLQQRHRDALRSLSLATSMLEVPIEEPQHVMTNAGPDAVARPAGAPTAALLKSATLLRPLQSLPSSALGDSRIPSDFPAFMDYHGLTEASVAVLLGVTKDAVRRSIRGDTLLSDVLTSAAKHATALSAAVAAQTTGAESAGADPSGRYALVDLLSTASTGAAAVAPTPAEAWRAAHPTVPIGIALELVSAASGSAGSLIADAVAAPAGSSATPFSPDGKRGSAAAAAAPSPGAATSAAASVTSITTAPTVSAATSHPPSATAFWRHVKGLSIHNAAALAGAYGPAVMHAAMGLPPPISAEAARASPVNATVVAAPVASVGATSSSAAADVSSPQPSLQPAAFPLAVVVPACKAAAIAAAASSVCGMEVDVNPAAAASVPPAPIPPSSVRLTDGVSSSSPSPALSRRPLHSTAAASATSAPDDAPPAAVVTEASRHHPVIVVNVPLSTWNDDVPYWAAQREDVARGAAALLAEAEEQSAWEERQQLLQPSTVASSADGATAAASFSTPATTAAADASAAMFDYNATLLVAAPQIYMIGSDIWGQPLLSDGSVMRLVAPPMERALWLDEGGDLTDAAAAATAAATPASSASHAIGTAASASAVGSAAAADTSLVRTYAQLSASITRDAASERPPKAYKLKRSTPVACGLLTAAALRRFADAAPDESNSYYYSFGLSASLSAAATVGSAVAVASSEKQQQQQPQPRLHPLPLQPHVLLPSSVTFSLCGSSATTGPPVHVAINAAPSASSSHSHSVIAASPSAMSPLPLPSSPSLLASLLVPTLAQYSAAGREVQHGYALYSSVVEGVRGDVLRMM